MFNRDVKKFPTISEKLEKKFMPEDKKVESASMPVKFKGLLWSELVDYGVIRERKEQNDDITVIKREFMSWDKTQWFTDEIIISTDKYREFLRFSNVDDVQAEIADLELEIEICKSYRDTESLPPLYDQIKFLKEEFEIKD